MGDFTNNTNILLVGKTGVGKSSLINYIYDKPGMCPTGDGKPVTGFGVHPITPFRYRSMMISPYDSSGFEGGEQIREWKRMLEEELKKNDAKEVKDWFHTIVYCISAESGRIDSFEEIFISDIVRSGNKVIFALTKSDTVDEGKRGIMKSIIAERFGDHPVVEICNVAKRMRSGKTTMQFGRDDMLRTICRNFRVNLIFKAVRLQKLRLEDRISDFHHSVMKDFDDSVSIFTSFDDDFRNERETFFRRRYKLMVGEVLDELKFQIEEIDRITRNVLENLCCISVDSYMCRFKIDEILDFSRWKNVNEFWGGIFPLFRKRGEYRGIIASELRKVKVDFREKMNTVFGDVLSDSAENKKRTDFLLGFSRDSD